MMISPSTSRAFEEITARQADLRSAFTPGAVPARSDVARDPSSVFTANPLSVAAPAGAYFIATDDRGRQTYARDGVFHLEGNTLSDRYNRPVLGFGRDGGLSALRTDPVDRALGRAGDLSIAADGSLGYTRQTIDPQNGRIEQARVVVGRLALARFAAATKLQPLDATRSLAPQGVVAHVGTAQDGNFDALSPHQTEQSRIDLDRGIERLQDAYLAFDALRAAHHAQGNVQKAAMDLVK